MNMVRLLFNDTNYLFYIRPHLRYPNLWNSIMNKKDIKVIESTIKTNLTNLSINKSPYYTVKFLITVFLDMASSRREDEVYIANCLRTALPVLHLTSLSKGESKDA